MAIRALSRRLLRVVFNVPRSRGFPGLNVLKGSLPGCDEILFIFVMTSSQKPKLCVILGAGASFDVWNEGSPKINEAWRAPLALDLFNSTLTI